MRWKTNLFSSGGISTALNTHQQLPTSQFNCGKEKMSYKIGCGLFPDWTFQQKLAFSSHYLAASCLTAIKKMLFHMSLTRLMINPIDFCLHCSFIYFRTLFILTLVCLLYDYSLINTKQRIIVCLLQMKFLPKNFPQVFHFSLL